MNDACRYREKGEKQKGGCPCTPTTVRSGRGTVGTGGIVGKVPSPVPRREWTIQKVKQTRLRVPACTCSSVTMGSTLEPQCPPE